MLLVVSSCNIALCIELTLLLLLLLCCIIFCSSRHASGVLPNRSSSLFADFVDFIDLIERAASEPLETAELLPILPPPGELGADLEPVERAAFGGGANSTEVCDFVPPPIDPLMLLSVGMG